MNRKTGAIIAACSALVFVVSAIYAITGSAQNGNLFTIISTMATIPIVLFLWANFRATQTRTEESAMNELSSCAGRIVEQLEEMRRQQEGPEYTDEPEFAEQPAPRKKILVPAPVPVHASTEARRKAG